CSHNGRARTGISLGTPEHQRDFLVTTRPKHFIVTRRHESHGSGGGWLIFATTTSLQSAPPDLRHHMRARPFLLRQVEVAARVVLADLPVVRGLAQQALDQGEEAAVALLLDEDAIDAGPHQERGIDHHLVAMLERRAHARADDLESERISHTAHALAAVNV